MKLRKKPIEKSFICLDLWYLIDLTKYSNYLDKFQKIDTEKWVTKICKEIKYVYNKWNIEYEIDVDENDTISLFDCYVKFSLK